MTLSGRAKVAGVVGSPIAHSLSPALQGYWLEELKIDGALVPLAVAREDFARVVESLRRASFRGINVTVPHKEAAFALAHFCDSAAQLSGAANLLIFHEDGRIEGRNTDWLGLRESLREGPQNLKGQTVTLLGAGGAARGAVLALDDLGAKRIRILNRHPDKAAFLGRALQPAVKAELFSHSLQDWPKLAAGTDLLINTTSAGMKGQEPLALDVKGLKTQAWVVDIVYNPLETALLKQAKALGHPMLDGLGMLMHQAVPSFEAFFGTRPKVSPGLRAALIGALNG